MKDDPLAPGSVSSSPSPEHRPGGAKGRDLVLSGAA